ARQNDEAAQRAREPFARGTRGEGPYQIQYALQDMMQDLVGIVRNASEMQRALHGLEELRARANRVGVGGHREYNPGWHAALDLPNLLTVSEAITRSGLERRESRGGHFRDDYPKQDPAFATFNIVVCTGAGGAMRLTREPIPPMPDHLKAVIEE